MVRLKFFSPKLPFILFLLIVAVILLHYIGILSPVENFFVRILSPVQSQVYILGRKFSFFSSRNEDFLTSETSREEYEQKIQDLLVENQKLKNTIGELESLVHQKDFLEKNNFQSVSAKVIAKDFFSDLHIAIIDKGLRHGIQKDFPVIIDDGMIIGKIFKIEDEFSHVLLLSDPQSQLAATFSTQEDTNGIVVGDNGITLRMDLIPKDIAINEHDVIITSGFEKNIPKGLIIGQVLRSEKELGGFFQTAYIRPFVSANILNEVSVIISHSL